MTGSVRREVSLLRRDTISRRVAAILALALSVAFAFVLIIYVLLHNDAAPDRFRGQVEERIEGIVGDLKKHRIRRGRNAEAEKRNRLNLCVETSEEKPDLVPAGQAVTEWVEERLEKLVRGRPYFVADAWKDSSGRTCWWSGNIYNFLLGRRQAMIAVDLKKGKPRWAVFTFSTFVALPLSARQVATGAVIGGLLVVLFSVWVSLRTTEPVRRFSDAAVGGLASDPRAASDLPETGPTELRSAARNVNRVLGELRRVAEDRRVILAASLHGQRRILFDYMRLVGENGDSIPRADVEWLVEKLKEVQEGTATFLERDLAGGTYSQEVDLAELVTGLCANMNSTGGKARYSGPRNLVVPCWQEGIGYALGALIDNAVRYGKEADVALIEDEDAVRVIVGDRGPGIPADKHEAVFEPFTRLESSADRAVEGSGLGLFIARSAVELHGGEIVPRDRQGGGLEAVVTLPKRRLDR